MIDPRPYQAVLGDQAKGQQAHAEAALVQRPGRSRAGPGACSPPTRSSQQANDLLVATSHTAAADVVSAKASVAAAALNLTFTRITAPMSGRISDRRVAPGNLVTADTTVLTNIVNLDPIRFAFTGSEALYLKYERENAGRHTRIVAPRRQSG